MDFVDKKEEFADLIEAYVNDREKEKDLIEFISKLKEDIEFMEKDLFKNIFNEIEKYLPDLSDKELRQYIKMIRSYLP